MIDAVIVTADSRDMVLRCLAHLPRSVRAIVVDNGSADGTAEAVAAAGAHVVRLAEPTGLARAFNRGAAAGDAELVLFLNDDILARDGSVERLAAALDERPHAVAAGGRLVEPDTLETQARYLPAPFPTLGSLARMLAGLPASRRRPDPALLANTSQTVKVDQPAGACLLVRRAMLERIGGWDERFFFWYEDVDICRRLAREGDVLWVPAADFRHEGGASFARWDRARSLRSMLHGVLQYGARHLRRGERVGLALVLVAVAAPRVVVFARWRPELAALYRDVLGAAARLLRGRDVPALITRASGADRAG